MTTTKNPPWWPTAEQKRRADQAHLDTLARKAAERAEAEVPRVLDDSQRNNLPTGRVTVTAPEGFTDRDLAHVAGFNSSHHGVDVTRYDDGTALVSLWND